MYWMLYCGSNLEIMRTNWSMLDINLWHLKKGPLIIIDRYRHEVDKQTTIVWEWRVVKKVAHVYSYMSRLMGSIFFNIPISTRNGTRNTRSDCDNSKIDYATTLGKEKKRNCKIFHPARLHLWKNTFWKEKGNKENFGK